MTLSEMRQKIAEGLSADWLFNDLAGDISMFDCLNLAQCAAERAKQHAGHTGDRFREEYRSSQLWVRMANDYVW